MHDCEGGRKAERDGGPAAKFAPKEPEGAPKVARRWARRPEGGQTSDGRRNRPTNFGPLDVDLYVMKNRASGPSPSPQRLVAPSRWGVMASRRIPKVDKRRTEGGTDRLISATSLEIYWI